MAQVIKFEIPIEDALELSVLLNYCAKMATQNFTHDISRANFTIRIANEFEKQLLDKSDLDELRKAVV